MDILLSVAIANDRQSGIITDATEYSVRSDYQVYLSGYKMNYDNTVAETLTVTPNTGDPTMVSSWVFNIPADGWFKFYYVAVGVAYDSGITYNIYDAVYSDTGLVYRSKIGSNIGNPLSDSASWEFIEDPSILANNKGEVTESINIDSLIYQRVLSPNAQYGYGNFISEKSCCSDCDQSVINQQYTTLNFLVNSVIEADFRTELPQGEVICRKLQAIFSNC